MAMRIRHQIPRRTRQGHSLMLGFSMIEMMIVIALILIVSGFAVISTQGAVKDARVTGAFDTAFMQLRMARERSIEERKRYIVTFGAPAPAGALTPLGAPTAKSIQVYRWDSPPPPAAIPPPVQLSTIDLPSDVDFQAIAGLPNTAATVPDGFGSGNVALDFDQGVSPFSGSANTVMFLPDGSAHDLNGTLNNGILYLARTGDLGSSRAITVFASSGRVRGWRLSLAGGAKWSQR